MRRLIILLLALLLLNNLQISATAQTDPSTSRPVITADNARQLIPLERFGRGWINDAAWSPDGQYLALGGSVGTWLYDAETLQPMQLLDDVPNEVKTVAWSFDSTRIAMGGLEFLKTVHSLGGRLIEYDDLGSYVRVDRIFWSPDGQSLRLIGDSYYTLTNDFWELLGGINDYAWSVNGYQAMADRYLRLLVVTDHNQYQIEDVANTVAFSPDGAMLAYGRADGTLIIVESVSGDVLFNLQSSDTEITDLAWSPDNSHIAASDLTGNVTIWSLESEAVSHVLEHEFGITDIEWSPTGDRLVVLETSHHTLDLWTFRDRQAVARIWNPNTGEFVMTLDGFSIDYTSTIWSPAVNQVPVFDNNQLIFVYDLLQKAIWEPSAAYIDDTIAVIASPDGQFLAALDSFNAVLITEVGTDTLVDQIEVQGDGVVHYLEWSSTSDYLAIGYMRPDGSNCVNCPLQIWDANSQAIVPLSYAPNDVIAVQWSPDGRYLAGVYRGYQVMIRSADDNFRDIIRFNMADSRTRGIAGIRWQQDGKLLVIPSTGDPVLLWDPNLPDGLIPLDSETAVRPETIPIVAVGDETGYLHVMDVWNHRELFTANVNHPAGINEISWSPDGTIIASTGNDGTVILWGIPRPDECVIRNHLIVNRRESPSIASDIIGRLSAGEVHFATTQTLGQDGLIWFQLEDGGWVRSDVVLESDACRHLPSE